MIDHQPGNNNKCKKYASQLSRFTRKRNGKILSRVSINRSKNTKVCSFFFNCSLSLLLVAIIAANLSRRPTFTSRFTCICYSSYLFLSRFILVSKTHIAEIRLSSFREELKSYLQPWSFKMFG